MYNPYSCVCTVAVPSAGSVAEPVSCQSYDSEPLALIASLGKEEERRLLPFNGHILLPFYPPFLFIYFFSFAPFSPAPEPAQAAGWQERWWPLTFRGSAPWLGAAQPGDRTKYLLAWTKEPLGEG